jgi:hypothetical protein
MMDFTKIKKLFIGGLELKQLLINGIQVWKSGYKNWVKYSIDTDGSIYQNGKGYIDGYRLSSSGSLSSQANTVTTGFIPCKSTDLIRMAGVEWLPTIAGTYTYISFFDASFKLLGSLNCQKGDKTGTGYIGTPRGIVQFENEPDNATSSALIPTKENGVYIMDQYRFKSDADKVAYFRINGYGSGADMIVTVNEEIA